MNTKIILINKVLEELMSFSDKIISYFPAAQKEDISLFEKKYKLELLEDYKYFYSRQMDYQ